MTLRILEREELNVRLLASTLVFGLSITLFSLTVQRYNVEHTTTHLAMWIMEFVSMTTALTSLYYGSIMKLNLSQNALVKNMPRRVIYLIKGEYVANMAITVAFALIICATTLIGWGTSQEDVTNVLKQIHFIIMVVGMVGILALAWMLR